MNEYNVIVYSDELCRGDYLYGIYDNKTSSRDMGHIAAPGGYPL